MKLHASFLNDADVSSAGPNGLLGIMPLLILSQPVNAMAFVLDGVVFGSGAFVQSCQLVAVAAVPSLACMAIASSSSMANWRLLWVWIGLLSLMAARAGTSWWSLRRAVNPLAWMADIPTSGNPDGGEKGISIA